MAAFALAHSPVHVLAVRTASWIGRGMRGPVRDALLAEAVPPEAYATERRRRGELPNPGGLGDWEEGRRREYD